MPVAVFVSPGFPRNAAWSRRSLWTGHPRLGVPVDGRGVRGQQGRDRDDAAGDQRFQGRPPLARRHGGRRCPDVSEANQVALQAAGLSFILGPRIPYLPGCGARMARQAPRRADPRRIGADPALAGTRREKARGIPDRVNYYQFRHDRARRTLRGIDEQVAKAERAVDAHAPVKRNRFIQLFGATKITESQLEAKSRALAGWKGCTTNLTAAGSDFMIDAYHQLWHLEKAFRMSKHDLADPPDLSQPTRINRSAPEHRGHCDGRQPLRRFQTGWSIKKFVRTTRRYRTVKIKPATRP